MKNLKLRKTILAAILIAIGIVLTTFVSITYPPNNAIIRFGIGFLPLMIISIILGPRIGIYSALIQDVGGYLIYALIFGPSGPFFPGFTLNALLFGLVPGLIYNLNLQGKRLFTYINLTLVIGLIGFAVYSFYDMPNILVSINSEVEFEPWVLYAILVIGLVGLVSILAFIIKHRKEDDSSHRIIFTVIVLMLVINLFLTPLWVQILYGIPMIAQLPLRLVKVPFEVFIYSILLIRVVKILNIYMLRQN